MFNDLIYSLGPVLSFVINILSYILLTEIIYVYIYIFRMKPRYIKINIVSHLCNMLHLCDKRKKE